MHCCARRRSSARRSATASAISRWAPPRLARHGERVLRERIPGFRHGLAERARELLAMREISIGDFVLSGGELPAMVLMDAVIRLLPGVLGHADSAAQDSFVAGLLDYPHYTRPEEIEGRRVPAVLLSGDHARIARWRYKQALGRSFLRRPDLVKKLQLGREQQQLLDEFLEEQGRVT